MTADGTTTMSALDDRPLPWIIAHRVKLDSPLAQALDALEGTVAYVDELFQVRQKDFNVLVIVGDVGGPVESHLDVLHFAPQPRQNQQPDYGVHSVAIWLRHGARAARFGVGAHARALGLEDLVKRSLLSHLVPSSEYRVLKVEASSDKSAFEVLAEETDGSALAGIRINKRASEWWMLSAEIDQQYYPAWLEAALVHWKQRRPLLFPADGYGRSERWMTFRELTAAQAVAGHEEETESYLQERERQLAALRQVAEAATHAAAGEERRLIEGSGDELVEAVMDGLIQLGFEVVDSDKVSETNKAAKREDLKISLASKPGWVALVEVKGYERRSAKANDLLQLAKAAGFYAGRHDREVDSQWYVVNANYGTPPDRRPIPLGSSPEDVERFAATGGAVIDTRELFKLLRSVKMGTITEQEAQESLIAATSIYEAPGSDDLVMTSTPGVGLAPGTVCLLV